MAGLEHWENNSMEKEAEHVPDVTADIELSMNKFFLNELEEGEENLVKMQQIRVPPLNPLMLYTISLHKHANSVTELIKLTEVYKNPEKVELKMPQFDKMDNNKNDLNFTPQDFKNFARGEEVEICELSSAVAGQVLSKCISTLFAHIGYETSHQSALDVLSDVLQDFLKKISHNIKLAMDDKEMQRLGFPNVIERVLTEMGMGGVKGLDDYYQSRVIKYVSVLENRCKDLTEEYQALLIPKVPSPVNPLNELVGVKVEKEDVVEIENPEVHFSTIEGDVNFSILERGYQLLNSLEAEFSD